MNSLGYNIVEHGEQRTKKAAGDLRPACCICVGPQHASGSLQEFPGLLEYRTLPMGSK